LEVNGGGIARRLRSAKEGRGSTQFLLVLLLVAAVAVPGLCAGAHQAEKKGKKKQETYALLVGTVFDENGYRVPDAEIRVREKGGKRHWEAASDARGEFSVHLPPGPFVCLVGASKQGFSGDSTEVSFSGDERQDVSLRITRKGAREPLS
jgi:hypothetical protein